MHTLSGTPDRTVYIQHMVEDVDKLALLIAAAIHDLDHMGRTSSFLVNAEHSLALLYNDMWDTLTDSAHALLLQFVVDSLYNLLWTWLLLLLLYNNTALL